ncbi:MAG: hypothetical protein CMF42_03830 [Legionellales bacterium]|nr:hypothetical protein [Legionellales bacterium]OUX67474.1 MAG: hypothetical protein CBD38_02210 [bacterium TMED178]
MQIDDHYQPNILTLYTCLMVYCFAIVILLLQGVYTYYDLSASLVILPTLIILISIQIYQKDNNALSACLFLIVYWLNGVACYIAQQRHILFFELLMKSQFTLLSLDLLSSYICDYTMRKKGTYLMTPEQWQLVIVRLFVGLAFVPYFSNKLFLQHQLSIFVCVELIVSLLFVLGLFIRFASLLFVFYLLVMVLYGFENPDFTIWFQSDVAWEYPIFWLIINILYGINGSGALSFDHILTTYFSFNRTINFYMANDDDSYQIDP